jgi:DsbC/DsbD-like thiol-disulfide interchange protein
VGWRRGARWQRIGKAAGPLLFPVTVPGRHKIAIGGWQPFREYREPGIGQYWEWCIRTILKEKTMLRSVAVARAVLAAAAVLGVLVTANVQAQKGAKRSDSVVKATAKAEKPDPQGKQVVTLTLQIDSPWHIYANKLPEDFPGRPTTVAVEAKTKPDSVKVDYPPGKAVKDKMFGEYHVYEEKAEIKITVQRARGDNGPLTLNVKVSACSDKQCLVESTIPVKVD